MELLIAGAIVVGGYMVITNPSIISGIMPPATPQVDCATECNAGGDEKEEEKKSKYVQALYGGYRSYAGKDCKDFGGKCNTECKDEGSDKCKECQEACGGGSGSDESSTGSGCDCSQYKKGSKLAIAYNAALVPQYAPRLSSR